MLGHAALGEFALGQVSAYVAIEYSLTAEAGAFTFTGQSAGVAAERTLSAGAGALALAGQDVGVTADRALAGGIGAFTLAGQDIIARSDRVLVASHLPAPRLSHFLFAALGEVALGGTGTQQDITTTFALSLKPAGLFYGLQVSAGAFTFTGQDVNLELVRSVAADTGAFTFMGQVAGLTVLRYLIAETGVFVVSGGTHLPTITGRKIKVFPRVGMNHIIARSQGATNIIARSRGSGFRAASHGG
jgi:hypothetical protein